MNMKGIVQNPQMELLLFAVIEFHLHFTFQEAVKLWKCYKKTHICNPRYLLCASVVSWNLKDSMLHFSVKSLWFQLSISSPLYPWTDWVALGMPSLQGQDLQFPVFWWREPWMLTYATVWISVIFLESMGTWIPDINQRHGRLGINTEGDV